MPQAYLYRLQFACLCFDIPVLSFLLREGARRSATHPDWWFAAFSTLDGMDFGFSNLEFILEKEEVDDVDIIPRITVSFKGFRRSPNMGIGKDFAICLGTGLTR